MARRALTASVLVAMVLAPAGPTAAVDDPAIEPVPMLRSEVGPWPAPPGERALVIGQDEYGPDWDEAVRTLRFVDLDGRTSESDVPFLLGLGVCPGGEWVTSWMDDVVPEEPRLYVQPMAGGTRQLVLEGGGWVSCLEGASGALVAWMPWRVQGAPLSIMDPSTGERELVSERVLLDRVWTHAPSGRIVFIEGDDPQRQDDATEQTAVLLDTRTGERSVIFGPGEERTVDRVIWSPDGSNMALLASRPWQTSAAKVPIDIYTASSGDRPRRVATVEAMPDQGFDALGLSDSGSLAWAGTWTDTSADELERLHRELLAEEARGDDPSEGEDEAGGGNELGFEMWRRIIVIPADGEPVDIAEHVENIVAWTPGGELVYLTADGRLMRWAPSTGAVDLGHDLSGLSFDDSALSASGRYLALTNGWAEGPGHPFEVLVLDLATGELQQVYSFDGANTLGWMSWWDAS